VAPTSSPPPDHPSLGSHCEKEIRRILEPVPGCRLHCEKAIQREIDRLTNVKKFGKDLFALYIEKVKIDSELASMPTWVKSLSKMANEFRSVEEILNKIYRATPIIVPLEIQKLDKKTYSSKVEVF
jgi:hypothetical protein